MDPRALQELCDLARLDLSGDERETFSAKFDRLLGFVDAVQAHAARAEGDAGSEAHRGVAEMPALELRADVPSTFEWPDGYLHEYKVPKVIDFEAAE